MNNEWSLWAVCRHTATHTASCDALHVYLIVADCRLSVTRFVIGFLQSTCAGQKASGSENSWLEQLDERTDHDNSFIFMINCIYKTSSTQKTEIKEDTNVGSLTDLTLWWIRTPEQVGNNLQSPATPLPPPKHPPSPPYSLCSLLWKTWHPSPNCHPCLIVSTPSQRALWGSCFLLFQCIQYHQADSAGWDVDSDAGRCLPCVLDCRLPYRQSAVL